MEIDQNRENNTSSDWLVWPGTIRLVLVAAAWFSLLLLLLFCMKLSPAFRESSITQLSLPLKLILGVAGVGGALSGQFLLVAMLWYWVKFDYSPKTRKTMWFLSFFICMIGIPTYALLVYRKQVEAIGSLL
jgi:hypothetical protein